MDISWREIVQTVKTTTDQCIDKTTTCIRDLSQGVWKNGDAVKRRSQKFVDTGVIHYQQTEQMALDYVKDRLIWMRENELVTYSMTGAALVLVLPGLRRFLSRQLLRPFRSDESIYRSAEARLESVQANLKTHQGRTEKLNTELATMLEAFTNARQQLKAASQELNSFSNQIHRDIRHTTELLRDMKEMPSRPTLKMQSEAAMALSALDKQNRHVDNLLYKVMQKGI